MAEFTIEDEKILAFRKYMESKECKVETCNLATCLKQGPHLCEYVEGGYRPRNEKDPIEHNKTIAFDYVASVKPSPFDSSLYETIFNYLISLEFA